MEDKYSAVLMLANFLILLYCRHFVNLKFLPLIVTFFLSKAVDCSYILSKFQSHVVEKIAITIEKKFIIEKIVITSKMPADIFVSSSLNVEIETTGQ